LDFIAVKVHDENINYQTMSDKEIIDRVASTNKQIKQGKTISNDDLHKESQNW
jgi:hypothetical protein